ncbi:I78 family peptidase inhibitor [Pseudomonas sp. 5P_5.1_Bac1]|uniref:I78 family peptidase inhibitor n=1 Tax=Pseudomonas sp. 5P_5.1_Bac1 TaxID=2971616 RepID=UPI0021C9AE59|nr:I78 family peptidase inhibitor [Pseudomonas sp. 5P_5.1_Bac1]MCU1724497.1 I78 family peptidase inhibitor [Pseudomonas sp. 5P_5.1_Bac1]
MTNEEVLVVLNDLIGTAYAKSTKAQIGELTGRTRIVAPGEATTLDYDLGRIHILTGGNGLIEGFNFG